jgi:hypothetical protein
MSNEEWTQLDRRTDNTSLKHSWFYIHDFPISNKQKWRFIRLKQTGKNHHGNDILTFSAFELFGELFGGKPI